ncbi:MAG: GDP-mannose pyrophosphorylase [Chloroflexi bacterium]|nr:GDP-mannose pyrophosphorylase [Chloroflexota bacterium]
MSEAMDALVLVGGMGTRLLPVVYDRPKPMAEVAGLPFVEWLLLYLRRQGLRRVILATGHQGEMVETYFGNGARLGLEVSYSHESSPLGTGGAMALALPKVQTTSVLVLNGDSFCAFDAEHMLSVKRRTGARALLWLVWALDCQRYGTVETGKDNAVLAFREKAPGFRAGAINAGVYLLQRDLLTAVPQALPRSLEIDVFPSLIGHGLYAVTGTGPFLDIGTPESYRMAESFVAENVALWHGGL